MKSVHLLSEPGVPRHGPSPEWLRRAGGVTGMSHLGLGPMVRAW